MCKRILHRDSWSKLKQKKRKNKRGRRRRKKEEEEEKNNNKKREGEGKKKKRRRRGEGEEEEEHSSFQPMTDRETGVEILLLPYLWRDNSASFIFFMGLIGYP